MFVFIVLLAALSIAASQSVHLFLHRMPPHRFSRALARLVIGQLVEYGLWIAIVWRIGALVTGQAFALVTVARAVGLAYAPRLFSFFTVTPFFGKFIGWLVLVWRVVAFVHHMQNELGMTWIQAVSIGSIGWIAMQLWHQLCNSVHCNVSGSGEQAWAHSQRQAEPKIQAESQQRPAALVPGLPAQALRERPPHG